MLSEFEFIDKIRSKYGLEQAGDDCAVLPQNSTTDLLITADMLVEDIDFRLEWTTPELLGAKVLAVSLSDIAAMGGDAKWSLLSIGIPQHIWSTDFLDKFYEGWHTLARHYGVKMVGGDVSRTPDKIVFDSIVGGEVPNGKAILRSGAKPGDSIYVTGELGGAAGGLMLLEAGIRYPKANSKAKKLIVKQLRPTPQLLFGKQLQNNNLATAMIDLSDGLSSDLHHLCDASGVGARIYAENIPIDPNLEAISLTGQMRIGIAIGGGEDFELLFTSPAKEISGRGLSPVTRIGEITDTMRVVEVVSDGQVSILPRTGYRHF